MNERRWSAFLEHARRTRAKPNFQAEERQTRLELAEEVRGAVEAGTRGASWAALVERALWRAGDRGNGALAGTLLEHPFRAGKSEATADLRSVLGQFVERRSTAQARFEAFAAAAAAGDRSSDPPDADVLLELGALLNFAFDPYSQPIITLRAFELLERTLGSGANRRKPLKDRYREHLAFAELVRGHLVEASIPIDNALDLNAVMLLAFEQYDFWTAQRDPEYERAVGKPPLPISPRPRVVDAERPYLSICAICRDEGPYLAEWIEFHRLVGVERFFIYDNGSVDDTREILAPYIDEGVVVWHEWPLHVFPGQLYAYDDCIAWHRGDSRWIAFIDCDEFLFSPSGTPVSDVLTEYEGWPGVGAQLAFFYFCGHCTKPDGLVTASYRQRIDYPTYPVKSIVDPLQVVNALSAHHFMYKSHLAVDETHYPITGPSMKSRLLSKLRVNHYFTKSEEEFRRKVTVRPKANQALNKKPVGELIRQLKARERRLAVPDDAISPYLERLGAHLKAAGTRTT